MTTLVVAEAACASPTLLDTDRQPVREPAFLLSVPYGWVAVDTAAGRSRVVAELLTNGDRTGGHERGPAPALVCPAGHVHRADRMRRSGPYCFGAVDRERRPEGEAWGLAFRGPDACTYLVRAEYRLAVPPAVGDTLTLIADRWRAARVLRRR